MTVPTETSQSSYTGDGAADEFSTGFYFLETEHVVVKLTPAATGVEETQVEGVDYEVTSPAGVGLAGSVTFFVPPAVDDEIVIERTVPIVQDTSLRQQGAFSPQVHEEAFDFRTFVDQQLERRIAELEGLAGGLDGTLTFGDPVEITDSTTAAGSGLEVARSNHQHAHGDRAGGTLHEVVVAGGDSGFMSGADKTKIDAIPTSRTHVRAERITAQALVDNTPTVIIFATEEYDSLNEYNVANGRFTAAETGFYLISSLISLAAELLTVDQQCIVWIAVNGVPKALGTRAYSWTASSVQVPTIALSTTVYLTAGQYVEVVVTSRLSASMDVFASNACTYLTIDRLV